MCPHISELIQLHMLFPTVSFLLHALCSSNYVSTKVRVRVASTVQYIKGYGLDYYLHRGTVPGTVCHLDSRTFTFNPATSSRGSVTHSGATHTAADRALAIVVITRLPWCPRTKAAILCQVPHLQRGFKGGLKSMPHAHKLVTFP